MDTPRPTRPGIGNGARWSDIEATLRRIDTAIDDDKPTPGLTSRDGGLRYIRPGEAAVPGDIFEAGTVRPDDTIEPWAQNAHAIAALRDLDPTHSDSAQVAADLRAHIASFVPPRPSTWTDTSSPIQTADRIDAERAALEAAVLNANARITESFSQLVDGVNAATPDRILAIDGPLSAAEAEAIRDLVTAQPSGITDMPQLDDATIAELRASIQRQLTGIVTPTADAASADAAFAVRGAYEDRFLDDEPRPPLTYEQLIENIRLLNQMDPPPGPIQLTRQQFDLFPKTAPREPWQPDPALLTGVPVELVDTVEESTPYRLERERTIERLRTTASRYSYSAERDRNAEQIERIFGEQPPKRDSWIRRAIRRLLS